MVPLRLVARASLLASLAASLLVLPGCSLALQTDGDQCTVDADCTARGTSFAGTVCKAHVCEAKPVVVDPKWGCIGHVKAPVAGGMDTVSVQLLDLFTQTAAQGVTLKLCNKYDTPCATPLSIPTQDAQGFVTVTLPSDLEAYLDVQGGDYVPSIVFLDHVNAAKNTDILLVPQTAAVGLANTAKVTLDPTKAILLVRTVDCTGARTDGVSTTLFPLGMATRFYTINQTVTPNATETDSGGNAGFVNVDPGPPAITATIGPSGKEIGKISTLVRAGYLTFQLLGPTPTL
jgi:hypothetical protein